MKARRLAPSAVIFDIGGVLAPDIWETMLLDPERGLTARHGLRRESVIEEARVLWDRFALGKRLMGPGDEEHYYWSQLRERFGLPESVEELIELTSDFVDEVPGMMALVQRLHRARVPMAICSNTTEFWYERLSSRLGLDRFFPAKTVVLSCHLGVDKQQPSGDMFRAAAEALNLAPGECILIDDRPPNIERAIAMGFLSILFPRNAAFGHQYVETLLRALLPLSIEKDHRDQ